MSIPRSEYPRPQFERADWLCLNGIWEFEMDVADTGAERGLLERSLEREILVPFCPESKLSGIGHVDYMNVVWYRRAVTLPATWAGRDVLLHFQAVDYETTIWINGKEAYRHRGGFSPFTVPLADYAKPGESIVILVRARDLKHQPKAAGKQSLKYGNYGCFYTRTTGIWQTVWMEPVAPQHLKRPRITPNLARRRFEIEVPLSANVDGSQLEVILSWKGRELSRDRVAADVDFAPRLELAVPADELHLWGPGEGNLYDIVFRLYDASGACIDEVKSYAGLRGISIEGKKVKINGKSVFQRQVLDQGYYPDGILTAPSEAALIRDIELSMAAGFNCGRLHQKVFEERFIYHCDRLGYLVWGEFPDWGLWGAAGSEVYPKLHDPYASAIAQWGEVIERDYSHPSIIGWCGLCETGAVDRDGMTVLDDLSQGMFRMAKTADKTRPILDTSGHHHRVLEIDVIDIHDYDQDVENFRKNYQSLSRNEFPSSVPAHGKQWDWAFHGQPFFVSEFGGIKWHPDFANQDNKEEVSWGYGEAPRSLEEFYTRFDGLCRALLDNEEVFGFCYTQLTDVYQEQNGVYFFDRSEKFDLGPIRAALTRKAAIEG